MGTDENIRVGTAEREAAIAELGEHFSAGRLDISEYEQRCGIAAAARTQAELRLLFDDLPTKAPAVAQPNSLIRHDNPKNTKAMFIGFGVLALGGLVVVVGITSTWFLLAPILVLGVILFMMS
ncbi:DUF1707 domain-containing protein [Alloactinosynnema sp. L-07]|uniref:DUF1707 SHOCT-like domain-containing protein n=1 Tax=Alloactinosynnema sp. L-07 TaxID=1653480 RepID=UPI0006B5A56A|nr:DUF1707 domain-containing protein [Alloactinosynnema sp. L-07]